MTEKATMSPKQPSLIWAQVDSYRGNTSSPTLTYHRPCPICGSIKARTVLELTDFQFYTDSAATPKRVDIRECLCLSCFALYLNPCYSDYGFQVLFAEAGQSYGSSEGRPAEQREWMEQHDLLRPNALILDVGCYDGSFLSRLPANVRKLGVDIDEPAIQRGRARSVSEPIEFIVGDFESFEYGGVPPDTITMFHVLEHLPRPVSVLRKLRSISNASTRLVVEVPILENGRTNDVNGFLSVQHMTHFSRTSLRNCLEQAGWQIIEQREQPDYNGYRILATPCQPFSAIAGNPVDVSLFYEYLSSWYSSLVAVEKKLLNHKYHSERCVIWGGGAHTEFLYQLTTAFSVSPGCVYAIVDSDELKQGKTWRGIPIDEPAMLTAVDWSQPLLLISSYASQESIAKAALQLGVPPERIIRIYDFVRRY